MMFDTKYMALLPILFLLLIAPTIHAAWSWLPTYNKVFNVSVSNWNYSAPLLSNQNTSWVLVQFGKSNLNFVGAVTIRGYTSSLQNIGIVPFYSVPTSQNTTVLVSRFNTQGAAWNTISIFFNSTVPVFSGTGLRHSICPNNQCNKFFLNGTTYELIGFSDATNRTFLDQQSTATSAYSTNPSYVNTGILRLNFTTQSPILMFVNRSVSKEYFNATYQTGFNTWRINATTGNYMLASVGFCLIFTCTSSVTNTVVKSMNANTLFRSTFDGNGFEGYFATTGNVIASEGMAESPTFPIWTIANAITSKNTYSNPNFNAGHFDLAIQSNVSQQVAILPSFTSNYVIANNGVAYTNPNPSFNNTNVSCFTFSTFNKAIPITNINWTYNFTSVGFNTNPTGLATSVPFTALYHTGFLVLNLPHYNELGSVCQNAFMYENDSGVQDSVPFFLLNNNLTTCSYLIQNTTKNSFAVNSVDVYIAGFNLQKGYSDPNVYKKWFIMTGNFFNISDTGNVPYITTLNQPLNLFSSIQLGNPASAFPNEGVFFTYNGLSLASITTGFGAGTISSPDIADQLTFIEGLPFNYNAVILGTYGAPLQNMVSHDFVALALPAPYCGNVAPAFTITGISSQVNCVFLRADGFMIVKTFNGITATSTKLYTKQATINNAVPLGTCSNSNFTVPHLNVTQTIPQTSNGVSYNSMTTINFQSNNSILMIGDTGIALPLAVVIVIQIVVMIMSFALYEEGGHIPSVVLLVIEWIIGIFNVQLLAIAIIGVLGLVVEHYILDKETIRKGKRGSGSVEVTTS